MPRNETVVNFLHNKEIEKSIGEYTNTNLLKGKEIYNVNIRFQNQYQMKKGTIAKYI